MTIDHVAVLGLGTMGAGIAQLVASSGRTVTALEADEERARAGRDRLAAFLARGLERGQTSEADRDAILDRVTATIDPADLAACDLVIEAVSEQREVKAEVLGRVAEHLDPAAPITTNTSALSVTDLATRVPHPERVAGLHFFNPAPLMSVVEVVRAISTAADIADRLVAFVESLGKTPVLVKDRPGFLVNHLLMPYLNDVLQAYDDGLADAQDIDTAIRLGLGYRLGPLELLDMIGLDVHEHATRSAYEATHDPAFAPPPLLAQMVAAGHLGRKTGRGLRVGGDEGA